MQKFTLILAIGCFSVANAAAESGVLRVGDTPPNYVGKGNGFEKVYLDAHRGKVVIVTFWASWCVPCLRELPVLNEIQRQVGDDRMKVVAVQYKDSRANFKKMKRIIDEWRLEFAYDSSEKVAKAYNVKSVPHMYMIDHEGRIVNIHVGYNESALDGIVSEVNELLHAQAIWSQTKMSSSMAAPRAAGEKVGTGFSH